MSAKVKPGIACIWRSHYLSKKSLLVLHFKFGRAQKKAIKTIRKQVFQIEQGVTEELEFDGLDESATHLLAYWKNQPVGTARIRKITEKTAKIERLSVLPLARRQGIGKALMEKAIEIIRIQNYHTVVIYAQEYVKSLYQKLGFEQVGNVFEEANIPHVKMTKKLDKNNSSSQQAAPVISDKNDSQSTDSSPGNDHPQFRAVGIIKGEVKFNDEGEKKTKDIQCLSKLKQLFYLIVMLLALSSNWENPLNKLPSL